MSRDKGVRVARTPLGKGVFAQRPYPESAIVGEIHGEMIDDPRYGSDYCMDVGDGRRLEPASPFRFVNHSCEPNCEFDWFDVTSERESVARRRVFLIALRDIGRGEQLTIEYNWAAGVAIPCRCQSPTCRGWIVDPEQLESLRERLAEP